MQKKTTHDILDAQSVNCKLLKNFANFYYNKILYFVAQYFKWVFQILSNIAKTILITKDSKIFLLSSELALKFFFVRLVESWFLFEF